MLTFRILSTALITGLLCASLYLKLIAVKVRNGETIPGTVTIQPRLVDAAVALILINALGSGGEM